MMRTLSLVALCGWISACFSDLTVGGSVQLLCTQNAECPQDFQCVREMCRRVGSDTAPPSLTADGLDVGDGLIGILGKPLRFTVSEPLASEPVIEVLGENGSVLGSALLQQQQGEAYEFFYVPHGDEPQDVALGISVALIDTSNNQASLVLEQVVTFDLTPPALSGPASLSIDDGLHLWTDWRAGAVLDVSFTTREALAVSPTLTIGAQPIELVSAVNNAFVFSLTQTPEMFTDGVLDIVGSLTDEAGNEATLVVASVRVDNSPPAAPLASHLHYTRSPPALINDVPSLSNGGEVSADAGTVDSGVVLFARSAVTGEELTSSRVVADAAGGFAGLWVRPAPAKIEIAAVDNAGNASAYVQPLNNIWNTNLIGVGTDFVRHEVWKRSRPSSLARPLDRSVPWESEAKNAWLEDLATLTAEAKPAFKMYLGPGNVWPAATTYPSLAVEPASGNLLLFGGLAYFDQNAPAYVSTLWRWRGARWERIEPAISPAARHGAVFEAMPNWDTVILFGGRDGSSQFSDTWEWDGSRWLNLSSLFDTAPQARSYAAAAYDTTWEQLVLFGGCDAGGCTLADTWVFNEQGWTEIETETTPPARGYAGMVYSAVHGGVVMFGGTGGDTQTWLFDGLNWSVVATPTTPPARSQHQLTQHPVTGHPLMVGGSGTSASTTWELTSTDWVALSANCNQRQIAAATANKDGLAYVYGGTISGMNDYYRRLLAFDGVAWHQLSPHHGSDTNPEERTPYGRADFGMVFDTITSKFILMGGTTNTNGSGGYVATNEMWTWVAPGWSKLDNGYSVANGAMAHDPTVGRTFLLGGMGAFGGDNLRSREPNGSYADVCVGCNPRPSARSGSQVAWDQTRSELVVFGGWDSAQSGQARFRDDTWTGKFVTGAWQWTLRCNGTCGPTGRYDGAIAYDEAREVTVMHGGHVSFSSPQAAADTWEWNGSSWQARCGASALAACGPSARYGAGMAYDNTRARTLLFAGATSTATNTNDLWEWDGSTWAPVNVEGASPEARAFVGFAFDPNRGVALTHGAAFDFSQPVNYPYQDSWELEIGSELHAVIGAEFFLSAGEVDGGDVQALSLRVVAGGRGYTTDLSTADDPDLVGEATAGVTLWLWHKQQAKWVHVATNNSDADAPGELTFNTSSAQEARAYILPASQSLLVQVRPLLGRGNGDGPATVALDALAVSIGYAP